MENQVNKNSDQQQPKGALIGVGELFKKAFEDYKNNFSKLIIFMLIPMAATFAFGILAVLFVGGAVGVNKLSNSSAVTSGTVGFSIVFFIIAVIILILINLTAMAGMFITFRDSEESLTIKEIINRAKKNIGGYLWISILTGILVMLWALLLIIPGIIFGIYYTLSVWVFFKEGKKGMAAIKRSHDLIKNYWWAVFGRLVLVGAIFVIVSSVLEKIGGESISGILSWLFGPFIIAYQYNIYKSLVGIKGGVMIENIAKEAVIKETEKPEIKKESPEDEAKKKEMSQFMSDTEK